MKSFIALAMTLSACSTEPQTSSCEALCDWAVSCAEAERPVDAVALKESCLTSTRASSDQCTKAEDEGLDAAASELLTECTDAVAAEASAGSCEGFTGTLDELKTGAPPAECATVPDITATYDAARDSTTETGAELCTRFSTSYCQQMVTCTVGDTEVPDSVVQALGGTPFDLCVDAVEPQTTSCTEQDLYAAEASLDDANLARQAARACLEGVAALACGDITGGEVPEVCAGSFSSTEDALAFAQAVAGVAADVQKAMGKK